MPRRDVWIKKTDVEIWDSLPNRSQWLHEALQRTKETTRTFKLPQFDKPITVQKHVALCKNGHILDDWGYCMGKPCKYGR